MGLLGDSWDDPRSMAVLQMAAGLLGPGGFGTAAGRGLMNYQGSIAADTENKLRKVQLSSAMLANQRQQQMFNVLEPVLSRLQGVGQPQAPQAQEPTRPMSQSMMFGSDENARRAQTPATVQQSPQASKVNFPLSFGDVTAMKLAGLPDLTNDYKMALEGVSHNPGAEVTDVNGNRRVIPTLEKGMALNNGAVSNLPGYTQSLGEQTTATKSAEARAANANALIPADMRERFPSVASLPAWATLGDLLHPSAPSGTPAALAPAISADMRRNGIAPGAAAWGAPSTGTTAGGFKTSAELAGERLGAEQGVRIQTDPVLQFRTQLLTKAHEANQATLTKLSDTVREEAELQNRNKQILPMLDKIQTGGFNPEERIQFANSLQTSNLVPEAMKGTLAKWIAGGDPTTGKVIENQLAAAGIKTMLDTLDKEGKPNRAIFESVKKAQESVLSGNATLKEVFNLQKQLYDWHFKQEQELASAMSSRDYNPLTLSAQFSKSRDESLQSPTAKPTMRWNPQTKKLEPA